MGKSVRINVSLPEQLHGIYAEVANRTGVSLPQVLVNTLGAQAAYTRRWMATWDFRSRDVAPFPADNIVEESEDGDGVPTPARAVKDKGASGLLSRQQKRRQEQLSRKAQRVASK